MLSPSIANDAGCEGLDRGRRQGLRWKGKERRTGGAPSFSH